MHDVGRRRARNQRLDGVSLRHCDRYKRGRVLDRESVRGRPRNSPFIRKVDTRGIISSVTNDNTTGPSCAFGDTAFVPLNIAVDSAGNLYDVELTPDCARKLSPDGTVTVVAGNGQYGFSGDGGPATQARLNVPNAITLDNKGNIYLPTVGEFAWSIRPGSSPP